MFNVLIYKDKMFVQAWQVISAALIDANKNDFETKSKKFLIKVLPRTLVVNDKNYICLKDAYEILKTNPRLRIEEMRKMTGLGVESFMKKYISDSYKYMERK